MKWKIRDITLDEMQQGIRLPLVWHSFQHLVLLVLTSVILVGVLGFPVTIFIWIFLMLKDWFSAFSYVYWLFRDPLSWGSSSGVFAHYSYWVVCFSYWFVWVLYIFWTYKHYKGNKKKAGYWMKGVLFVPLVAEDNQLLTLVRK